MEETHNTQGKSPGTRRGCAVCGRELEGKQRKNCADCGKEMFHSPTLPKQAATAKKAAGRGGAPLQGLSIGEISRLAWGKYGMSYGKLVGYVQDTGRLPPKR